MRRVFIAALALGATIGLSFLPYSEKVMLHTKGRLHLWGHVFVFAMLTAVALWCVKDREGRLGIPFGLVLLAISLEVAQHFFYRSPMEPVDIGADILGILFIEAGFWLKRFAH